MLLSPVGRMRKDTALMIYFIFIFFSTDLEGWVLQLNYHYFHVAGLPSGVWTHIAEYSPSPMHMKPMKYDSSLTKKVGVKNQH